MPLNQVMNAPASENAHSARRPATSSQTDFEVAIIGAGPYGLSAASHLKDRGISVRVFGEPMAFWATTMPDGMLLRSPREASNLSDPSGRFSLEAFERAVGKAPVAPLPLETFVEYGRWFRQQFQDELDTRRVESIRRDGTRFVVKVNGDTMRFQRVVVAAGVGPFMRKPSVFQRLDKSLASHCYEGHRLQAMGRRVVVIGAGQSALECAALLHEGGADVEVIARIPELRWIGQHPWLHRMGPLSKVLYSKHDVGPAGISRLVAMPNVVRHVPLGWRDKIRTRAVRPAGAKWLPNRVKGVTMTTGRAVAQADEVGRQVRLLLDDGSERIADHVLLGTGYSVDIAKYEFLSRDLVSQVETFDGYPKLTPGFRTSVPGLHFIGATAARSFGPLMYFVAGTDFTSHVLTADIVRNRIRG